MNMKQTKNKLMATMIVMLLFASVMLAVVPIANAAVTELTLENLRTGDDITHDSNGPYSGSSLDVGTGDKLNVTGVLENAGATASVYWNSISPENRMNAVPSNSGTGYYEMEISVPVVAAGEYWILVVEEIAGGTAGSGSSKSVSVQVVPKIELDPTSGTIDDTIKVTGTGFTADSEVTFTFGGASLTMLATTVKTDSLGCFVAYFKVPTSTTNTYPVVATDDASESATADFTVGPSITLSKTSGPSGTVVTITGKGFYLGGNIGGTGSTITLYSLAPDSADTVKLNANQVVTIPTTGDNAGTFTISVVIPDYIDVATSLPEDMLINVTSSATDIADAKFTLTGLTGVIANPIVGAPDGDEITIACENFTQYANNEVNLRLVPIDPNGVPIGGASYEFGSGTVDATTGKVTIKTTVGTGVPEGVYYINATDRWGLSAVTLFIVAPLTVTVDPARAPSGAIVTVTGNGFDLYADFPTYSQVFQDAGIPTQANMVAFITIGGINVTATSTVPVTDLAGGITNLVVPTLPVDANTVVNITTNVPGLTAKTTLNVNATTTVTVTPNNAIRSSQITIGGSSFGRHNGSPARVLVFYPDGSVALNTTTTINYQYGTLTSVTWTIPNNAPMGTYTVNVTDASTPNRLTAETTFNVVEFVAEVTTRSSTYHRDSAGTFLVSATVPRDGAIFLYAADDRLVQVYNFSATGMWIYDATTGYYNLTEIYFKLPQDAVLGNWTWLAVFPPISDSDVDGRFVVTVEEDTTGSAIDTDKIVNDIIDGILDAGGIGGGGGTQGDKGDTGPQGPAGSAGSAGPRGDKGATGDTGDTGPQGPQGPQGEDASPGWSQTALALAIVALVVGAVAAFLAITLRRKIAN
jgi:hypothetical protein